MPGHKTLSQSLQSTCSRTQNREIASEELAHSAKVRTVRTTFLPRRECDGSIRPPHTQGPRIVLIPKKPRKTRITHNPESPTLVEWVHCNFDGQHKPYSMVSIA